MKKIIFFDRIGRTITGEVSKENDVEITIKNPCVFQISPNPQTREFNMTLLPVVLFELINPKTKSYEITYCKNNIEILKNEDGSYVEPTEHFINARENMFNKLSSGEFEKIVNNKSDSNKSTPEIIEVK